GLSYIDSRLDEPRSDRVMSASVADVCSPNTADAHNFPLDELPILAVSPSPLAKLPDSFAQTLDLLLVWLALFPENPLLHLLAYPPANDQYMLPLCSGRPFSTRHSFPL